MMTTLKLSIDILCAELLEYTMINLVFLKFAISSIEHKILYLAIIGKNTCN